MVSRLHAKTNQIGKLLSNLEKYNHLMKDGDGKSPTTPSSTKSFIRMSPTSPTGRPLFEKFPPLPDKILTKDERLMRNQNLELSHAKSKDKIADDLQTSVGK